MDLVVSRMGLLIIFRRKGMHNAEPEFQVKGVMVRASFMPIYEVNQDALSKDDPSVYREDIIGIRHPDAAYIAAANPAAILSLIEESKRMREARKTAYDALLEVTDVRDRTKDGTPEREIAQAAVMAAHKVYFAGEAVDPNYAPDAALEPKS